MSDNGDEFAGKFTEQQGAPSEAKTNSGGASGQSGGPPADEQEPAEVYTGPIRLKEDFIAYLPRHSYFFTPTREPWTAGGINARFGMVDLEDKHGNLVLDKKGNTIKVSAAEFLDNARPVEQMTWLPGEPMLIKDKLITIDGPIERADVTTFNLYLPPTLIHRRGNIAPWRDHLYRIYPDEAAHMEKWLAQRVKQPQVKINHALVLGGEPGIGKDSILEPVKRAVGRSNVHEVSPQTILAPFNGYLRAVLLRVNEARDLGEYDRFKFYISLVGPNARRKISIPSIGIGSGTTTTMAVMLRSPLILPNSPSRPLTRKRRRRRQPPIGKSSPPIARRKTPS